MEKNKKKERKRMSLFNLHHERKKKYKEIERKKRQTI